VHCLSSGKLDLSRQKEYCCPNYGTETGEIIMSNVAKALKAEIARISRKEVKSAVDPIAKSNTGLKKIVVDLKRRVTALEKENKRLLAGAKKDKSVKSAEPSEEAKKARITSTTIRSLRKKLGLSQADFGKLAGVTTHMVYLWETKEGPLNLREKSKAAILSFKGMGAREAKGKLANAEEKK
jgi:DNA-binding transcriptional regulator YiaG